MTNRRRPRPPRALPGQPSAPALAADAPPTGTTVSGCPVDPDTAARLAARPQDPRRRLPVPAMNARPGPAGTETGDFLTVDPDRVMQLAMGRLCAVCGQPVRGEYAVLVGPASLASGASGNPSSHEGCLLASLRLCPWISIGRARRAAGRRAAGLDAVDPHLDLAKPQVWVLGVAADYTVETHGDRRVVLRPGPYLRQRRFRYDDAGALVETPW